MTIDDAIRKNRQLYDTDGKPTEILHDITAPYASERYESYIGKNNVVTPEPLSQEVAGTVERETFSLDAKISSVEVGSYEVPVITSVEYPELVENPAITTDNVIDNWLGLLERDNRRLPQDMEVY